MNEFLIAVHCNNVEKVASLLKRGTNINVRNVYGDSAMTLAIKNQSNDMIELLLDYGVNINETYFYTREPALIVAAKFEMLQSAKLLVKSGFDVNSCDAAGKTPLIHA